MRVTLKGLRITFGISSSPMRLLALKAKAIRSRPGQIIPIHL